MSRVLVTPFVISWLAILSLFSLPSANRVAMAEQQRPSFRIEIQQITFGTSNTFFGYIGHVRTIPWNEDGRYVLALRSQFQNRMPLPHEPADIVLIDTRNDFHPEVIEQTRAWNFQQGTMLYWNPMSPKSQFFFNDRDPATNDVFCVLYDVAKRKRIAEYRYADTPIGNSGVAQQGGWILGINYGRLARLRPVTGYPGVRDWSAAEKHPTHDGIFKIDSVTQAKELLVSYKAMGDAVRHLRSDVDEKDLFVNHTLWSRNDSRIFVFVRGDFEISGKRLDIPLTMNPDGTDLTPLALHIGGHPEWKSDNVLIGSYEKKQVLFDVSRQQITGSIGSIEQIPNAGGDVALSPDGEWFVNGFGQGGKNYYNVVRLADGAWTRSVGINQGGFLTGELRIDSSPLWNRAGNQLLVCGVPDSTPSTRQLFLLTIRPN
ncbi:MAG: hypothetical protein ABL921_08120 [Pirellula sp.]